MGETIDHLAAPLGRGALEDLHHPGVQGPSGAGLQAGVDHLVGEGVLEAVLGLGATRQLVEELRARQSTQSDP